ncbi:MAG TPA: hypothetical protein VGB68_16655 [Pyrinomonadaceae bacterium]|jgi:hypothetical protein
MFLFDDIDFVPAQSGELSRLWYFLPIGYLTTILIETPILLIGLSPKLSLKQRFACGVWLTACTYPVVILVLPALLLDGSDRSRLVYLAVAETFAPAAECFFFWLAFRGKNLFEQKDWIRSFAAIVVANLASFGIGEILNAAAWFGLF